MAAAGAREPTRAALRALAEAAGPAATPAGVTRGFLWSPASPEAVDASTLRTLRTALERALNVLGRRPAPWEVTLQSLSHVGRNGPEIGCVTLSDAPGRLFVVARRRKQAADSAADKERQAKDAREKDPVMEVDAAFGGILERLPQYKQSYAVSIVGTAFELGDFVVRLGAAKWSSSQLGIVCEVEYLPSSTRAEAEGPLDDFGKLLGRAVQNVGGKFEHVPVDMTRFAGPGRGVTALDRALLLYQVHVYLLLVYKNAKQQRGVAGAAVGQQQQQQQLAGAKRLAPA